MWGTQCPEGHLNLSQRNQMFDWKDVLNVKVDDVLQVVLLENLEIHKLWIYFSTSISPRQDDGATQLQIQTLYEKLKTESIDAADENATKENLIHLFKLSQLVMQ